MNTFKRQDRYFIFKKSELTAGQRKKFTERRHTGNLPTLNAIVIEEGTVEYSIVQKMLKARLLRNPDLSVKEVNKPKFNEGDRVRLIKPLRAFANIKMPDIESLGTVDEYSECPMVVWDNWHYADNPRANRAAAWDDKLELIYE